MRERERRTARSTPRRLTENVITDNRGWHSLSLDALQLIQQMALMGSLANQNALRWETANWDEEIGWISATFEQWLEDTKRTFVILIFRLFFLFFVYFCFLFFIIYLACWHQRHSILSSPSFSVSLAHSLNHAQSLLLFLSSSFIPFVCHSLLQFKRH